MFEFSRVSDECIKCGKCIPGCTIHQVNPDEVTSPRGFIELLGEYQKGRLPLDMNAKDIFESCFLCTNCVEVCPNSLPTDMVIEEVRRDIAEKYGIAWYKRAFFWLLRNRWAMDLASKLGYVFRTCALKDDPQGRGAVVKFDLPMIKKGRLLPSLRFKSFLNRYPERIEGGKKRVAIFIGCLSNYNYTETGDALVYILKRLGYEIFIPKKQKCCAAPAYFTGDFDTVEELAKKNVEYFESFIDSVEAILIPEATCSAMIKHDWPIFFENRGMKEWAERARKINVKIHMATGWLYEEGSLLELLKKSGSAEELLRVTYHDPCHAKKVQGIYKEPRALLKECSEVVEMSDPDRCCGFGGVTIQSEKFHLAQAAGRPKAHMIKETGAQVVAAECSACRMQLGNAMYEAGVDTVFKNPLEIIAQRLKMVE